MTPRSDPGSSVLVVGAGAAGLATVVALRRRGHTGRIRVLGAEAHMPYDRPPLSKGILAGGDVESVALPSSAVDVDWILGTTARRLDDARRIVVDDRGVAHSYDHLVIATGLRPRRLVAGSSPVHVIRTLDDTVALRRELRPGRRLVVVGGGFLGLEVAATARGLGVEVFVVDAEEAPLQSRIGPRASAELLGLHRARGAEIETATTVSRLEPVPSTGASSITRITLSSGRVLDADVIVEATGAVPEVDWLAGNRIALDHGVACDEYCRAGDAIWAAGDVASFQHRGLGTRVRLEHRTNATEQAAVVAAGILGGPVAYTPIPFVWTDQYDVRLQVAGIVEPGLEEDFVEHGPGRWTARLLRDGVLVCAVGWNAPRELTALRRELMVAARAWEAVSARA